MQSDPEAKPSLAYYRAVRGAWRAPLSIEITDPTALRRSGMRWMDRVSLRVMAAWPRWAGRFHLETAVEVPAPGEVIHFTVVRWLGVALMRSREVITLAADGRRFAMTGEQRVAGWSRRTMSGEGSIDAAGEHAEYRLNWLGVPLRQETTQRPGEVHVRQVGPGFRGEVLLLRRQPEPSGGR